MNYNMNQLQRAAAQQCKDNHMNQYATTTAVEPLTPLQERAKQLAQEFEQLEAVIVELWNKLSPFLYDSQPGMEDKVPCKESQHSRMWIELDQAAARVCHNRIVLAQLLERIEV